MVYVRDVSYLLECEKKHNKHFIDRLVIAPDERQVTLINKITNLSHMLMSRLYEHEDEINP